MKIVRAETAYYQWPRPKPITNGLHTYTDVTLGVVKLFTDAGLTGIGISGGKPGEKELVATFCDQIVGMDPFMSEQIWSKLWNPKISGRRGLETRALSAIDFALWDIKAKAANLPLYVLLGGARTTIPTYVAGGYYTPGKGMDGLAEEMVGYVERGARAVKMKVGALSPRDDAARVKLVRGTAPSPCRRCPATAASPTRSNWRNTGSADPSSRTERCAPKASSAAPDLIRGPGPREAGADSLDEVPDSFVLRTQLPG